MSKNERSSTNATFMNRQNIWKQKAISFEQVQNVENVFLCQF